MSEKQTISENAKKSLDRMVEKNETLRNRKDALDLALIKAGEFKRFESESDPNE